MWKEEYKIGVESIDRQHFELFQMVEQLLCVIKNDKEGCEKEKYIESIDFMKKYVVKHFFDEEKYQEEIHYNGIEEHKAVHRNFTNKVLEYEDKLKKADFDKKMVKSFSGMLMAWLIYHVVDADQRIVKKEKKFQSLYSDTFLEAIRFSTLEVIEKMIGIKKEELEDNEQTCNYITDDIVIKIELIGDYKGNIIFGFSRKFAFGLIKIMTFLEVEQIDELVCSALAEMTNIISGNVTIALADRGIHCDIKTPVIMTEEKNINNIDKEVGRLFIKSEIGSFQVGIENLITLHNFR